MPCKEYGIAIEVCRAKSMELRLRCAVQTVWDRANCMGSRMRCAVQTVWDRDRGVPCKQYGIETEVCDPKLYGIAYEVCHANSMGSRSRCAVQTVWDRDRGVPCKQYGIVTEVCLGNSSLSRLRCG